MESNMGMREQKVFRQAKWDMLRSDIYIRDKGICWICNEKVELKDYDLGHLVDRCNGGQDDYDNLAVMHKRCNVSKPKHTSLEESMKWKLTSTYLTVRPMKHSQSPKEQLSFITTTPTVTSTPHTSAMQSTAIPSQSPMHKDITQGIIPVQEIMAKLRYLQTYTPTMKPVTTQNVQTYQHYSTEDIEAIRELTLEYFKNRPELLVGWLNKSRHAAIRQLAFTFNIQEFYIKQWIQESNLIPKRPPQITDGSQYRYVYDNLEILINRYIPIQHTFLFNQPKLMGISVFCMDIMFFLSGNTHKVSKCNHDNVERRVKQLNLPVRNIPIPS
jgi:hypothetical protein